MSDQNFSDDKQVVLTKEGHQQLVEELAYLESDKRREVANRLKEAVSLGDLSENSEYEDAKNEQAQLEARILLLTEQLKYAKIIDEDAAHAKHSYVQLGSDVQIKALNGKNKGEVYKYSIVGTTESNPFEMKISNESPLGVALLDKKAGEVVEVSAPMGVVKYEIQKIK